MIEGQYTFTTDGTWILNEAEAVFEGLPEEEKSDEELLAELKARKEKKKRKSGVRTTDLSFCKVERKDLTLSEDELKERFPEGYREMEEFVTRTVEYTPAELVVHEEHIHRYKSLKNDTFVTADHPSHLLHHGIVTPSLFSKIYTEKIVKAVPLTRISKEFGWLDTVIRPQTLARWMVKIPKKYLIGVYERMMKKMLSTARLIHCDETPFICEEDRKKPKKTKNSKSYMWVYHTADCYGSPPIFIYVYKDNRRTENVEEFLKDYKGIIMADGYEPYHTVARESNGDIVVAGCWAHAKRRFAEIIKANPKQALGTVAFEGNERIAKIYHIDNKMKDTPPEERLEYRKEKVAPLVNDLFRWAKERDGKVATEAAQRAITYLLNQEKYLREFLNNPIIPLDNSDAERSIRAFCVGKHNWKISNTSGGAYSSSILYSIAETSKANGLKPYEYMKYLLEQLLTHENEMTTDDLIDSLLPWSESLPDEVKATR
jgi:transposase